jgi:hypothetical protein
MDVKPVVDEPHDTPPTGENQGQTQYPAEDSIKTHHRIPLETSTLRVFDSSEANGPRPAASATIRSPAILAVRGRYMIQIQGLRSVEGSRETSETDNLEKSANDGRFHLVD